MKVAFLDRDGTIIKDYQDEEWRNISEPEFLEGSHSEFFEYISVGSLLETIKYL